jgi:hypothetical protein
MVDVVIQIPVFSRRVRVDSTTHGKAATAATAAIILIGMATMATGVLAALHWVGIENQLLIISLVGLGI